MVDFTIRVIVDSSSAVRGTRQVERGLNRTENAADRLRRAIARAFAVIGVGAAFTRSIRILADFEQALSTVRGITGATERQFAALREEAQRLGATTRFSATDAANGLLFLSRAGFEVEESLEAIGGTLTLAQAGALGLGQAADIASNVLQGFRLETDQTGRVVDVLALAANSANTSVAQLGQALAFVAPVAAGLGVEIEETSAAIGVLSNAGLQASVAGTGLRRVLAELESPSERTRELLGQLGVTADEVRVSQVGLTAAIERLAEAGVDTGRALEIFGQRGGPAFEVISASLPDLVELTDSLGGAAGTAENLAAIMDDNLNGALLAVRSALEAVVLALGEAGATSALTSLFRTIAAGLRELVENIDTVVNAAQALAIVLGVTLAQRAIPAAIAAVRALNAAILANPIGALITVIVGATSVLVAFADQITVDSQGLITLGDVGAAAFELIRENLSGLLDFFGDNFGFIADFARTILGDVELSFFGVLRATASVVDGIVGFFRGAFNLIVELFSQLPDVIADLFVEALNGALAAVESFANRLSGLFTDLGIGPGAVLGFTPTISLGRIETESEGAAESLGERLGAAFNEGFERATFAGDLVAELEERSEEVAIRRIVRERRELDRREAATAALERAIADAREVAEREVTIPGEAGGPGFATILRDLEREGDLLRLNIRDREIITGILRAEDALKRQLTATERERLTLQLELNRALAEQQAIGDFLGNLEREAELLRVNRQEREILGPILQLENQLRRELTATETEAVELALRRNQALRDQARLLDEIRRPQEEYERGLATINAALAAGDINQDQFARMAADLRITLLDTSTDVGAGFERGFLRALRSMEDFSSASERLVTDAFSSAQDAVVEFFQTGELNAQRFFSLLSENFLRLGTQQLFAGAFGEQGLNIGGLFSGDGFDLGSLFDFGSLLGFQRGVQNAPVDSLSVASIGGVDNRLVAFRARSDETVSVNRPGESGQRPIQIIQNISTPDVEGFRRSEGQILARTQAALQRANQRNN